VLVAVAGGNLQGVEAAYLARKAGWEILVIDRKPTVAASGLCNSFAQLDMTSGKDLAHVLNGVDLVLPALENDAALACLDRVTRNKGIPFAFDPAAYAISSCKIKSEQLFEQRGAPTPARWPTCKFPVIAKPNQGSGSQGVTLFNNKPVKPAIHSIVLFTLFIFSPVYFYLIMLFSDSRNDFSPYKFISNKLLSWLIRIYAANKFECFVLN